MSQHLSIPLEGIKEQIKLQYVAQNGHRICLLGAEEALIIHLNRDVLVVVFWLRVDIRSVFRQIA
jgi:hypothetical protein